MPIFTRATGALFDPATATSAAAEVEAEFAGAWARHEGGLRTADGQAVSWPPHGSGLNGGPTAADVAAALVFGAVSGVGRSAGLADR
jgi:hypothetical protein